MIFDDASTLIGEEFFEKCMHIFCFDPFLIFFPRILQIFFNNILIVICFISDKLGYVIFVQQKIVLTFTLFTSLFNLFLVI